MEPQYQWYTEEEEETDNNTVSYRTNSIRIALDTEKQVTAKIMAVQTNATVLSKTLNLCIVIGQDIESNQHGHTQITIHSRGTGK